MVHLFYTTHISVDLDDHEIFCAKFGNGGISSSKMLERNLYANSIGT